MSDGQYFGYGVLAIVTLIAVVSSIVVHEERQKRRKPNIRLPRRTAWDRFRQYQDRQRTN
jgi:hypothetical protein